MESVQHLHRPHLTRSCSGARDFITLDVLFTVNSTKFRVKQTFSHNFFFFGGFYSYFSAGLCFFHFSSVYARLLVLAQAPPVHGWVRGEPSVAPLILSSTTV